MSLPPGPSSNPAPAPPQGSAAEVFGAFLKLGCLSFGGPVAHLGYFSDEFVKRRAWMSAPAYADIVALCQFLPGPTSSQVGIALGLTRARLPGAFAAWLGFTLPSALLMILLAAGVRGIDGMAQAPWLHGLKIAAAAVVAQALVTMARALCPDLPRLLLAGLAALVALAVPTALGQVAAIAVGGIAGWAVLRAAPAGGAQLPLPPVSPKAAMAALALFAALMAVLPLAAATGNPAAQLFDGFYRAGALVFGGGHVVLPLLEKEVVPSGWVDADTFLAGYGAAQALPGPLFAFAGYLGAATSLGVWGGVLCLIAIFLPSVLLVVGALPFWEALRRRPAAQSALRGINAAVVGLLAAAFYDPVWTGAVHGLGDAGLALALFAALMAARAPSWLVVVLGATASTALAAFG